RARHRPRALPLRPRLPGRTEEGRSADTGRPHEGAQEVRTEAGPESSPVHEALASAASRRLDWPDCQNTRDLGGLPRPGGLTRSCVLIRSDHLGHLTEPGREAMQAYGVATVIDLRSPGEVSRDPVPPSRSEGVRDVHVAVVDDANRNNLSPASKMLESKLMIVGHRPAALPNGL